MTVTEVHTDEQTDKQVVSLVNIFDVDPSKQQELIDLLNEGAEKVLKPKPGFISQTILADLEGNRVMNCAQWTDLDAMRAASGDPVLAEYLQRATSLATLGRAIYRVAAVHHA